MLYVYIYIDMCIYIGTLMHLTLGPLGPIRLGGSVMNGHLCSSV